jgi:hypothetical protein
MSGLVIIGVDPGGRMTGIVARHGDTYLGHELVIRRGRAIIPDRTYLHHIAGRVGAWSSGWPRTVLAIEEARAFGRPRRRPIANGNGGLIALGKVVAALELYFPDAILVMPNGHGRNLLAAYPAPLVAPDELERLTGDGPLQHCRSAWDVAGCAQTLLRLAASHTSPRCSTSGTPAPMTTAASEPHNPDMGSRTSQEVR